MYDDLIKRLRDAAKMSEALAVMLPHSEGNATAKLYNEAADAIEELQEKLIMAETDLSDFKDAMAWKEHFDILAEQDCQVPKWIPVEEDTPGDFISVQAHMTDAGNFPSVREAYVVNKNWFFPALKEFHPVDMWKRFDEPPKEE